MRLLTLVCLVLSLAACSRKDVAEPRAQAVPVTTAAVAMRDVPVQVTATGTVQLKATFANSDMRLWPGQFANVVVTLAIQPNALVVPREAVQMGQQGRYVYVVKPDRTVEPRPVTVARDAGQEIVLAKGVAPGEHVVTDGQSRLAAGTRVEVKTVAAEPASPSASPATGR